MPKGFFTMRIRVMTKQDIPAGLRLNTLSGWNQLPPIGSAFS